MAIVTALVWEPRLDLAVFVHAAEHITGENPVREVDRRPGLSTLADHVQILANFTDCGRTVSITHIGFLLAGPTYQINQFIELTGGMRHIGGKNVPPDARAVLVVGTLEEWRDAVWAGNAADPPVRKAFNDIHKALKQRGFGLLFDNSFAVDQKDGTFLLRLK